MYNTLLLVHSWTRWLVLLIGIWAILRAFTGWFGNKSWVGGDRAAGGAFMGTLHLQLILGLLLYFVYSPIVQAAMADMGAAMKNSELRYWAVEHLSVMILAIVVAQIGRIRSKKASLDVTKHKRAAIFYTIAMVLILSRIPWVSERLFRGI